MCPAGIFLPVSTRNMIQYISLSTQARSSAFFSQSCLSFMECGYLGSTNTDVSEEREILPACTGIAPFCFEQPYYFLWLRKTNCRWVALTVQAKWAEGDMSNLHCPPHLSWACVECSSTVCCFFKAVFFPFFQQFHYFTPNVSVRILNMLQHVLMLWLWTLQPLFSVQ